MGMSYPAQSAIAGILSTLGQMKKKKAMEDTLERARQKGYDIEIVIDPETGKTGYTMNYKGKTKSELLKDELEVEMLKKIIMGQQGEQNQQGYQQEFQKGGFKPKGFSFGGFNFEREPGEQEYEVETQRDIQKAIQKEQGLQKVKGLPSESGGKLAMLQQALSDLDSVEKQLFTKEGKFLRGLATAANIPGGKTPIIGRVIPDVGFGTQAREINSKINNALEAKLRIETGAAATQEEFNRLQTRFGITAFDTAKSAKNKITRLKEFLKNAIITIDPTGSFIYKTVGNEENQDLISDPLGIR